MVPAAILNVLVKIQGAAAAAAELRGVDSAAKGASKTLDKSSGAAKKHSGALSTMRKTAGLAGVTLGGAGLAKGLSVSVKEYREAQKVGGQTNAVLKSTGGAANVTKKHVENLSNSISKKAAIDDEAIQSSANMLLTFTKVRNEAGKGNKIFDQATQTVTDMSVALGQSGKSSAIQLGKALNDPVKGVTALQRVGVTFDAKQKQHIKTLEQTGHHLEAQKAILKELKSEFGGSAAAQATAGDKMKVAFGNLAEAAGGVLVPAMDKVMTVLTTLVNQMIAGKGVGGTIIGVFKTLASVVAAVVGPLVGFVKAFQEGHAWAVLLGSAVAGLTAGFVAYKVITTVIAGATKAWTAAQVLLNLAMSANPIGIAIVAIAGLAAAFVVAYKKSETFRNIIDTLWGVLKTVFGWVKSNWPLLLTILTGPFGLAVALIIKHADAIKGVVAGVFGWIKGHWPLLLAILTGPFGLAVLAIVKHAGDIKNAVTGAFHAIIGAVKGMAGAIIGLGTWAIARIVEGVKGTAGALLNSAKWIKDRVVDGLHAVGGAIVDAGNWLLHRFIHGFTNIGDAIKNAAKDVVDKLVGAVKGFLGISSPSKVFEGIGRNMMKGLINGMGATDVLKFVGKHLGGAAKLAADLAGNVIGSITGSGRTNASSSQVKGLGRQLAAGFGWSSGAEWAALDALWTQESGWNPMARNKASGAFGIPQALPPTKMPPAAQRGEPGSQIAWGLNYIKGRYGDPLGAWAHEKAHNWYARGGTVPGIGSGDSVPAMLTPGEFVIRKQVVDKFGPTFFAALNGYNKGGSVALANLVDSKFGLHMTSGYRSPQHNAAVGGAPHSWHTRGTPGNPGAVDLVGPMKAMRAALAWVKANISGLAEAMIDNVGNGWNLHIAGPGLMNFKGLSEGGGGTRGTAKGKGNVVQIPPHTKKFLAQGREILAQKKAVKDYHARGGISAAQGFRKDTTINNPWLQAMLTHIDNLVAAGQLTEAQGNATKTGYLQKALPALTGENGLIAQGMIKSLAPPAGEGFYSVVEDRLSEINAQIRAGDLTAEQGRAAQIQTIQDNLGNPDLSDRDRLELRGELRDLTTATEDNTATIQAQTDAINAVAAEMKRNTDFATSVTATQLGTYLRAFADLMNGQIYGQYNNRSSTASAGSVARY